MKDSIGYCLSYTAGDTNSSNMVRDMENNRGTWNNTGKCRVWDNTFGNSKGTNRAVHSSSCKEGCSKWQ